ncbi:hypothetical protein AMS68_002847 [Peltaster fructicola]|uniref:Uncharacterized protein n=1 Tax=Peltaster fructicola TaxID=286661 RepID=A0A6H0XS85_9PEZI|nr:hypothetical protein AMS68_002847 [Peltaster fructicola]
MTAQSPVSQQVTNTTSKTDNVNPFESSRAYSSNDSTTSLTRPAPAITSPLRHHHTGSPRTGSHDETILGVQQEQDEKAWIRAHQARPSAPRPYDLEKAAYTSPRTSQARYWSSDADSLAQSDESLSDMHGLQAKHALKILLYLSGPCVVLSFITMIWALCALLITILYQPLRLCTPRLPFKHQLCQLLAPTLNLHLRCIYAQVFPRPVEGEDVYCALWLLAVHLVSPIISLGDALAAWTVALYWALASIVGDPSGVDKKDDGIEAVLGLTRWWESCLMKGVKLQ